MFGLSGEQLLSILWISVCLVTLGYSFGRYGYLVWFKPESFIKLSEEKKKSSPRWIRFFMRSTTVFQDLWIVRVVYLLLLLVILILFALLVRKIL
jgi:hypothetical protein